MKVIIHAGMHKTGSSSIQATLGPMKQDIFCYAPSPLKTFNYSGNFIRGFTDETRIDRLVAVQKGVKSREAMQKTQNEVIDALRASLVTNTKPYYLLSAEAFSLGPQDALERLRDLLENYTNDIKVVCYVRSPVSFMQSAFQQRMKVMRPGTIKMNTLWPKYRLKFQRMDAVFGRENVDLRFFSTDHLKSRDVVIDFADIIGLPLEKADVVRVNESMSREAVAVLYAMQSMAQTSPGIFGPYNEERALLKMVETLPGERLKFSADMVSEVCAKNSEDTKWMENRLGVPIEDVPAPSAGQVTSLEDLQTIAEGQVEAVANLIGEKPCETGDKTRLESLKAEILRLADMVALT